MPRGYVRWWRRECRRAKSPRARLLRRRLQSPTADAHRLDIAGKGLNQKLTTWWRLGFPGLRAELQQVFKRDIPVKEREDWEARRAEHLEWTQEIVRLETDLNARVYGSSLFD
jgi:hypothetical protein